MPERMEGLRHILVPEFVFGDGARHLVPTFLRNFDARNVLVVSDDGVIEAGWTGQVLADLDSASIASVVFSDVSSNPRIEQVMAGAALYERASCDAIVAVGGGSVIDCAKAVGIVASHGRDIRDFEGVDTVEQPTPPLICVSTTTTSADVSQFAIISDLGARTKFGIISRMIVPDVSLLDAVVYTTLPSRLTCMGGMDSLSQAIEAFVSNAHSPFTDLLALDAMRIVTTSLPRVVDEPSDILHRSELMFGNLLGGFAFSNASLGLVHATAHAVGGLTDAHHGACISAMLPEVVRFNYPADPERFSRLAELLGVDVASPSSAEGSDALVDALEALRARIHARVSLSDLGVRPSDIPFLVERALADPTLLTNPRTAEATEIEAIYERSLG